ncbi:MAG: hypothetical protein LBP76_03565 [Treponema sp.]|jgi:hypothetical protein|nr:hypothetical protein [Treponema sp.]
MRSPLTQKLAARIIYIIGFFLMFMGNVFLISVHSDSGYIPAAILFFVVILGSACAVLAVKLDKRSIFLFSALFFFPVGGLLFLSAIRIIPVSFSQSWPLLSVFAGLALLPTGMSKYGSTRSRFVIPAVAFIVLGLIFLIFSFDLVPFSFRQFIMTSWPLLVLAAICILIFVGVRKR